MAGNIPPCAPDPSNSSSASHPRSRVRHGQTQSTPSTSATNASPLSCTGTPTGGVGTRSASARRSSSWALGSTGRCA
ncbi:hypothetical protein I3W98_01325 [Streptomyces cavourensis]|nr:hypothetical protein [Streptomyces cavourensis]